MNFDWLSFLNSIGIEYVEQGPNVQRGRVAIRCPQCGAADPSHHLGIIVDTGHKDYGAWGCLRNDRHRGLAPNYLIYLLTGWSKEQIKDLVSGGGSPNSTYDDLRARMKKYDEKGKDDGNLLPATVELNDELERVRSHGMTSRFFRYLYEERGFRKQDVKTLIRTYRLRCALSGQFRSRLIIPFYRDGECYGWSGRDITGRAEIRYRSWPEGDNVKRSVFNYDYAMDGGEVLALCEGPLDVLKLDFYGKPSLRAVGLLGTSISEAQIRDVYALYKRFNRVFLVLDTAARVAASSIRSRMADLGLTIGRLPKHAKDPGELTRQQVREFSRMLREAA